MTERYRQCQNDAFNPHKSRQPRKPEALCTLLLLPLCQLVGACSLRPEFVTCCVTSDPPAAPVSNGSWVSLLRQLAPGGPAPGHNGPDWAARCTLLAAEQPQALRPVAHHLQRTQSAASGSRTTPGQQPRQATSRSQEQPFSGVQCGQGLCQKHYSFERVQ